MPGVVVVVVTECDDVDAFNVEGWGEEQEIRHFRRSDAAFPSFSMPTRVYICEGVIVEIRRRCGHATTPSDAMRARPVPRFGIEGRDEVIGERSRALCTALSACCSQFPLKPEHTYKLTKEGAI
jgi:hypothetical protein